MELTGWYQIGKELKDVLQRAAALVLRRFGLLTVSVPRIPAIANLNKDEAVEAAPTTTITRFCGVVVNRCLGSTCDTYDCLVTGYCGRGWLMVPRGAGTHLALRTNLIVT